MYPSSVALFIFVWDGVISFFTHHLGFGDEKVLHFAFVNTLELYRGYEATAAVNGQAPITTIPASSVVQGPKPKYRIMPIPKATNARPVRINASSVRPFARTERYLEKQVLNSAKSVRSFARTVRFSERLVRFSAILVLYADC